MRRKTNVAALMTMARRAGAVYCDRTRGPMATPSAPMKLKTNWTAGPMVRPTRAAPPEDARALARSTP
ncbi:hypothetical protein PRIPAC_94852 [Pristionchus pacificus]|uniref:Uncharacterized protein n=1 Tax=Pristionchus pacificus TaxID=54126 RepID=A0A2A6BAK3_PRIPA|nr:hypothetical protein PRIPAC_94852 [Pristionchus pacificus]|eukprot:PDM62910.1 hypothetical protein PRIPAC_50125 [Pristionchus pacificus]